MQGGQVVRIEQLGGPADDPCRGGSANLALFFSNQLLNSSVVGAVGGGHVLGEELHFYAMRRLTISSFLSRLIAIGLTVEHLGLHLLLHHAVAS